MGDRFARSLSIAKESYQVLRSNPALTLFPVLAAVATVIVSIPFAIPLVLVALGQHETKHVAFTALHYVLMACMYFANYFVVVFFNSALVACANEQLNGRPATFAFGVEAAVKRLPQIAGWALIASTVGLILRTIGERTGIVGQIVTSIIGLVWNIAVFFVVPVLVIENVGPITAVKNSTAMIKQTWGERLILGFGLGSVTGIAVLLAFVPIVIGVALLVAESYILGAIMLLLAVIYILGVAIISSALNTIFQTAIFLYCRTGQAPTGFNQASLQGAFAVKPQSKIFGIGIGR